MKRMTPGVEAHKEHLVLLSARVWRTRLLRKFALWYSSNPPERVKVILDHMDGRTFFAVSRIILRRGHEPCFQDRPHVLILNPEDATIRYDYALRAFCENVKELFVLHDDLEHYPVNPDKMYFREHFREEDMRRIVDFLNERRGPAPDRLGEGLQAGIAVQGLHEGAAARGGLERWPGF